MINWLILRLEAPMMSFGGAMVDNMGVIQEHPPLSMITGLLANALGYHHGDAQALNQLQARLIYGARQDLPGQLVRDYHTVDLGQAHLGDDHAWTTRHRIDPRAGGNSTGTHIRYRDYWADAAYTIALTLTASEQGPPLATLKDALITPHRPLFIGRKTCLPSTPIFAQELQADSVKAALTQAPAHPRTTQTLLKAWWPALGPEQATHTLLVTDARDWHNQVHQGQRRLHHERLSLPQELSP